MKGYRLINRGFSSVSINLQLVKWNGVTIKGAVKSKFQDKFRYRFDFYKPVGYHKAFYFDS